MAATPSNPAPHETEPRQPTTLSAVFRRIATEPSPRPVAVAASPRPAAAPRPAPGPSGPQLLGFAEPVKQVPPVEAFAPRREAVRAPSAVTPMPLRAVPPPTTPPPATPSPVTSARPLNLVGRLGRRLGEASPVPPRHAPPPVEARRPPAPAPEPAAPGVGPAAPSERAGRPSLPRNRRLYRRAALPAEIEIGGVPCTLIDVSIGGFAATGVPPVEANALVPVSLRLAIDGIEVGTQLDARIIYVTQGRSSGRFVDLSPSQMAFLRYIVTWRGESVGAVGTTTLLDAISGGAERGFPGSAGGPEGSPPSRWWAGLIGRKASPPR